MQAKQANVDTSRRRLLGGALALGAVGAVVGAAGLKFARRPARAAAPADTATAKGYHETEHIRDYYRSAV